MTEPLSQHIPNSAHSSTAPPAEDLRQACPLPDPNAGVDIVREPDRESPPSTPRWVKVFGISAFVLVLLFAGLHLTGNAPTHMPGSNGPEHGVQTP
jgi:hypothetical protein